AANTGTDYSQNSTNDAEAEACDSSTRRNIGSDDTVDCKQPGGSKYHPHGMLVLPSLLPTSITTPPPLLCSVGTTAAAVTPLLPPDNTCDILIYTHVRVFNQTVRAVINQFGYETFRNICATYTRTTCGLSFAWRFLTANMFSNSQIRSHLSQLQRTSRVNHYGVLDIYGSREQVENVSTTSAPVALTAMRQLLGNNSWIHKVFVGIGYYYYNGSDAWEKLSYAAENVASKDVDALVIISTVLSVPTRHQCIALPVNAHKSPNEYAPNMEAALKTARDGFGRRNLVVYFSLQMGVLLYTLESDYKLPISALYEPCNSFAACQATKAELNLEKSNIAFNSDASTNILGIKVLHSFDTLEQMTEKAMLIMETPGRRANFSWMLFNVELTDVTRKCLTGGAFERVREFKKFYLTQTSKNRTR
ncbi:hypothetical protein MRX96_026801, partial [Rhipicephalus microplus]